MNVARAKRLAITGSVRQKLSASSSASSRAIGVAHDDRCHRLRPAEVVASSDVEQLVDVGPAEPADVVDVVDVARRRADQHQLGEPVGLPVGGEHADHRGDRVADEHDVVEVEGLADLQDVGGVAVESSVAIRVVRRQVRTAGPDVIEAHRPEVGERRRDEAPHLLVTPVAVSEHHRLGAGGAAHNHMVPRHDTHDGTLVTRPPGTRRDNLGSPTPPMYRSVRSATPPPGGA